MLVLSRGPNDRIVFPALGISIEVLKVSGARTSLGVSAPKDIRVVRHELLEEQAIETADATSPEVIARHELRNQINRATLKLQLAAKFFAAGHVDEGLANMSAGMAELSLINEGSSVKQKAAGEMSLAEAKATFTVDKPNAGRVLLVDDDANERSLMASYLTRCGLEVDQASDGLKAMYALTKKTPPDVILMDMNMPNLDGPSTVHRIRKCSVHPNVPVFAVTGQSIEETGLTIGVDGVTAYFQKPVQVDEIVTAIHGYVSV